MKKKKKRGLLFLMSIVLGFFLAMFVGGCLRHLLNPTELF